MEKKVIRVRIIKNPIDWLKASQRRVLTEQESEICGYIGYNVRVDGNYVYWTCNNAWSVSEDVYCLKDNVIEIVDYNK